MIGPYDLSGSVGKPGQFDDDDVRRELERYVETSRQLNKPFGYHVIHPDHREVMNRIAEGYTFVAFSADFLFLGESCREQVRLLSGVRGSTGVASHARRR